MNTQQNSKRGPIVLVDDEPGVLRALELILRASGCTVTVFSDPCEAQKQLNAGLECRVLISDLRMPKLSGSDLISEVKKVRQIQSILISGHASDLEAQAALGIGIDRFLRKPFMPNELIRLIDELVEQKY